MDQPVAVVGMACRLPGDVSNPEELWEMLAEGRNAWTKVPKDRYNEDAFLHPDPDFRGAHNHRGGHFLNQDLAAFDAQFFGLSAIELNSMDPQQRLLLEVSYEALESGGIPIDTVRGSNTAVYVAAFSHDYDRMLSKDLDDVSKYYTTGTGEAIMSNRISHFYDLRGPSMTLDTGCSGSLVALHHGCQSLRTRESDMVLVAGVNLMLTPDQMIGMSNFNMLNDDGQSFAFDARGSGYGRGEGCVAVILKPLDDAVRYNDPIRAVIRSSGVNQDGRTSGITRPSDEAQTKLAETVLHNSEVNPREIGYIEAHGTGTVAGDTAEMQSIAKAYCKDRKDTLYVGSIKSNIGHLESVSGLAGLLKAILIIEKSEIPPQANLADVKTELQPDKSNVEIPQKLIAWQDAKRRLISVNSFGYGGTNAHVILEQSPEAPRPLKRCAASGHMHGEQDTLGEPVLMTTSARSERSLRQNLINLHAWASSHTKYHNLRDLAYTLSTRRAVFDWRSSFFAACHADFLVVIDHILKKEVLQRVSSECEVIFLFTGQGAQWAGMGRELYFQDSPFRTSLLKSEKILRGLGAPWNLMEEFLADSRKSRINDSELAMPICTALQIALVDLFTYMNIKPSTVIGHSSGEIAATYAAGILAQKSALQVAYHRGLGSSMCRKSSSKGAMLAVGLGTDEVEGLINQIKRGKISVACINSPSSTTVSGDNEGIEELKSMLDCKSITCRRLNVDTAYHSHHMLASSDAYLKSLHGLTASAPGSVKFVSAVTGTEKTSGFGPQYWATNSVSKVQYYSAITNVLRSKSEKSMTSGTSPLFVEIGPHRVLASPTRDIVRKECPSQIFQYFPTLVRDSNARRTVLESIGKLFEAGLDVDRAKLLSLTTNKDPMRCIPNLPLYAWDRSQSYWQESRLSQNYRFRRYPHHDILGVRIPSSTPLEPKWRNLISVQSQPWLKDHMVNDQVVFPGAAYICMAMEAQRQYMGEDETNKGSLIFVLRNVSFPKILTLQSTSEKLEMHLSLRTPFAVRKPPEDSWLEFRITAMDSNGGWSDHCSGEVRTLLEYQVDQERRITTAQHFPQDRDWNAHNFSQECEELVSSNILYEKLTECGNHYGPSFALVKGLLMHGVDFASALVKIPNVSKIMPFNFMQPHIIPPTVLDALMHTSLPLYQAQRGEAFVIPTSIGEIRVSAQVKTDTGSQLIANTVMRSEGLRDGMVDLSAVEGTETASKDPLVRISDMRIKGFPYTKKTSRSRELPVWTMTWEPATELPDASDLPLNGSTLQRPMKIIRATDPQARSFDDVFLAFARNLQYYATNVVQTSWQELALEEDSICIVLDDGSHPLLANLSAQSFEKLITLVTSKVSVLWISIRTHQAASTNAENGLMNGFARSAHAENSGLQLLTLDLQQPWGNCHTLFVKTVLSMLSHYLAPLNKDLTRQDQEFVFRDSRLLSPRISLARAPNDWVLRSRERLTTERGLESGIENAGTHLDSRATYIVAGGLGFVGRKICYLMVSRGARHIVTLSRGTPTTLEKESEEKNIQTIALNAHLYCLACDVSLIAEVQKASFSIASLDLPPVKGIIQSTVVLKDHLLSNMTLKDFEIPLQTKLLGTCNLDQVFNSSFLDFFVLLSSATATVGTRGQVNYTAGNAFQDAFAHSHDSPSTHYMSISPGIIEGAGVNDSTRERNLRLHGLVPVSIDDLMSLIDYSISPQAKQDKCKHAIIGFDERSLSQVGIRNANVHSGMFSLVRDDSRADRSQVDDTKTASFKESIDCNRDPTEVQHVIVTTLAKKMAELVSAREIYAVIDKPFVELGLDSLLSLELRDWIFDSFEASIQPSELELHNVVTLANVIHDRSGILRGTGSQLNDIEHH